MVAGFEVGSRLPVPSVAARPALQVPDAWSLTQSRSPGGRDRLACEPGRSRPSAKTAAERGRHGADHAPPFPTVDGASMLADLCISILEWINNRYAVCRKRFTLRHKGNRGGRHG